MMKHNIDRIVSTVLLIAIMVVIFMFSTQSARKSNAVSGSVIETIAAFFNPDFENLPEQGKEETVESMQSLFRTLGHFAEFCALGFFTANVARAYKLKNCVLFGWSIVFGTAYALSDEIHQIFVPGRAFQINDILVDASGCILGTLVFMLFMWLFVKIFKRKPI